MALIDQITSKFKTIPIDGSGNLTLSPSDFGLDFMDSFFSKVLQKQTITLKGASKKPGTKTITVTGTSDLLSYKGLDLSIVFDIQNKEVVGTVTATFDKTKTTTLPVINWIKVGNIQLSSTISSTFEIVTFGFGVDILVAATGDTIPVHVTSLSNDEWKIDIAEGAEQGVTANDLVALLGGHALESFLPKDLIAVLSGLKINGIETIFNIKKKTVSYFSIGVSVTSGWDIAPKVSLKPGLQVNLTLINPTDATSRQFSANISATFDLNTVEIPAYLGVSGGSGSSLIWAFGIQPGESVILPSFSDLLGLAGGQAFLKSLPDGLSKIPKIEINKLMVNFDSSKKVLTKLSFEVATASSWPIIPKYFEIEKLSVAFDVTNLTTPATREVLGTLIGIFKIDTVFLMCSIQKTKENKDWTITAGIAPGKTISLTKVAIGLFEGKVTVPKKVPDFAFSVLQVSVVPAKKIFNFKAQSADSWPVTNKISVELFKLNFTRDPANINSSIKGNVTCNIKIDTVEIDLSASINDTPGSGWQFTGSTKSGDVIPIGKLISFIDTKLGVGKPPKWINSITLKDLEVGFNSSSKDFYFGVTADIKLGASTLEIYIHFAITHQGNNKFTKELTGKITLGKSIFVIDFKTGVTDTTFKAAWSTTDPAQYLEFADLSKGLGFTSPPQIPSSLDLALKGASFLYNATAQNKVLILTAESANYGSAVFVSDTIKQKPFYGFGIDIHLGVTLADIPLVGSKIPNANSLGIPNAGAWIFSTTLGKVEAEAVNKLIDNKNVPNLPDEDIVAKVILNALLKLGNLGEKPITIPLGSNVTSKQNTSTNSQGSFSSAQANTTALAAVPVAPPATKDSTKWINIQRSFGIFQFNRIGFRYSDNNLFFVLDAGMTLGPLAFTMDGLSISSPLTKFKPKFDIKGLGLSYNKPPLEIEGALLKLPSSQLSDNTQFQFDGFAVVKISDFSLSAIGSYAQLKNGDPSLFVFAQLEVPIGGPPIFFITGLMAGFGFNRYLAIPKQNEVQGFPLLKLGAPPAPGKNAPSQKPEDVLKILEGQMPIVPNGQTKKWIKPSPGDYWLAVGLEFTSFELVTSKAILIIEFGHDLVFALLGLSTMELPQPSESSTTYAYVELQLEAVLKPLDGFFGVSAVLTQNSYVLTPDCHLTGGFAFYMWFGKNTHSGQFVITLGGYHPAFKPPSFFPTEPRLGFNWAVSNKVSIKGGSYFALTPSAVMAGGRLEALFHAGPLKAWFIAYLDVLISWRPFFFEADIGISIGISLRLNLLICHVTISLSIGASVKIWGPPTGGTVRVHLVVVSFTVHFGSSDASGGTKALDWAGFSELLPHSDSTCKINANSGMYKTMKSTTSASGKTWIVRARDFRFTTLSTIPANELKMVVPTVSQNVRGPRRVMGAVNNNNFTAPPIHVKPMDKSGVNSVHTLTIFKGDSTTPHDISNWLKKPNTSNVPESLWGAPSKPFSQVPAKPSSKVIDDQFVGYDVVTPPPALGDSLGLIPIKALAIEPLSPHGEAPVSSTVTPSSDFVPTPDKTSISLIKNIMGTSEVAKRKDIFDELQSAHIFEGKNESLIRIVNAAEHLYSDTPMVQA